MALPNPPVSANSSKLFAATYDNSGTNAAAAAKSVKQTTVNSEVLSHLAVGTHKDTDTYASGDACVLAVGKLSGGTTLIPLSVNSDGELGIYDGGNSITVDGSVTVSGSVSISGTPNVAVTSLPATPAGTNNIGDVDVLTIAAGTNTIGGTLDTGWDIAAKAPRQAFVNDVSATSSQALESADASNLYNIYSLFWTYYSGSDAPGAVRTIKFRFASGGTTFHTVYVPPTANVTREGSVTFRAPIRTALNNNVDVILSAALGTGGVYSAGIVNHKSTS